ncbi:carbohydrate ABC transporter permease [Leptolyngbya sp. FACHB-671]|uniref:carbohydrate ABC transporter permease n=1 Tax=Leptolyngbya sp. FACHB-671 TaxID=2692812 RepID=UPI001682CE81|nr:carbohydrate ABC transporter permease [Leptolyngbya sp. FACHB-671]MBD1868670.1 carbohydrate ABC transporter permease [Cyanobacteria bacterium FACHB-471]MBD2067835.1 carbohydrate ABC transporter permease [Leptolyngbya sp. FACHB-671]
MLDSTPKEAQPSLTSLNDWLSWLNPLLLLVGAGVVLAPLLIVFLTSLTPPGSVAGVNLTQSEWTWANYQEAWRRGNFLLAFANSTLVALAVTAFQIFTSALAGYALARLQFWGRRAVLLIVLATLVLPFQILVVPIFLVLRWGNLINTYGALILPTAANGFGIFLLRQYFQTIPVELEEAAALDGANRLQILWRVILPLARPALVTLFLFTFIGEWNDLFKPLVFTTRPELRTVQLALAEFQEQFTNEWALLMAAVVIATVPVVVLFLVGQRQFIRGIAATGIKN